MRHFLTVLIVLGCSSPSPSTKNSVGQKHHHPQSHSLHDELFSAAKTTDEARFQAVLTPQSIQMLDEYFNRMELLQRPVGTTPYGWKEFLRLHADLAEKRPTAQPYSVFDTPNGPRLDIANHPDAAFLKEAVMLPATTFQAPDKP